MKVKVQRKEVIIYDPVENHEEGVIIDIDKEDMHRWVSALTVLDEILGKVELQYDLAMEKIETAEEAV